MTPWSRREVDCEERSRLAKRSRSGDEAAEYGRLALRPRREAGGAKKIKLELTPKIKEETRAADEIMEDVEEGLRKSW